MADALYLVKAEVIIDFSYLGDYRRKVVDFARVLRLSLYELEDYSSLKHKVIDSAAIFPFRHKSARYDSASDCIELQFKLIDIKRI
jgi:hypothetical protein